VKHSVTELTLKNGARGLLIDVPDAMVFGLEISFRAGDFRSPKDKWEVAHIMEHMVMGANKEYPRARLFQAELQKNGAYMNASTSPYNLNYILESADFEWERILKLSKLGIESPIFTEEEFQAERGNVREELVGDLNHNFRQILIKARQKFGLIALPDQDRIALLPNISVEDIAKFHTETHTTGNMRFLVAGNVAERQSDIEAAFSEIDLPAGDRVSMPDEIPTPYDDVYYIEKPDLQNIYFFFNSFAKREFNQKEDDAMNLVNIMLTVTLHSRILGEARERGLAYHISSNFTKLRGSTGWWFGAELTPENSSPVFEIIVKEIKRLLDGKLDDEDLEAAKQYSLGKYQRSAQTAGGILSGYAGGYFFDDRVEDYFGYPDRIKKVSKTDIIGVVRALFVDDIWGLTVMGTDKEDLAKKLNDQLKVLWQD
jgi:predicted Zn-dependent peptidase